MKVNHYEQIDAKPVTMEGASGCAVRWLISQDDGAPSFSMRQFEVQPGGFTPRHSHPYEHEVFVLEGDGQLFEGDQPHRLKAGDVVLIKPDEVHQFRNSSDRPLKFLCLIPNSAVGRQVTVVPECGTKPVSP